MIDFTSWRFIDLSVNTCYMNMAIDEALMILNSKNKSPNTLRLYRWSPSAISIGYFQGVNEEVNIKSCTDSHVDIVRRITGGGAVYHDYNGEITYSLILNENNSNVPSNVIECYKYLCQPIINSLNNIGINACFQPINDIIVNNKKISGNAQTRRAGVVLQHGTILIDVNVEKMFSLLNVESEKIKDKLIKSVKKRVTSVQAELNKNIDFNIFSQNLRKTFSELFNVEFQNQTLTEEESNLAIQICEKYSSEGWLYQR